MSSVSLASMYPGTVQSLSWRFDSSDRVGGGWGGWWWVWVRCLTCLISRQLRYRLFYSQPLSSIVFCASLSYLQNFIPQESFQNSSLFSCTSLPSPSVFIPFSMILSSSLLPSPPCVGVTSPLSISRSASSVLGVSFVWLRN